MDLVLSLQLLTIIALPLYVFRFNFGIPTTLLEILVILTIGVTAFDFYKKKRKISSLKTILDVPIFLFLISVLIATVFTPDLKGALGVLKAYFIEPVLIYYCLVYKASQQGYKYIFFGLIISGIEVIGLSFLQRFFNLFVFAPNELLLGRITAFYNSANSLVLYLAPILIISLYYFLSSHQKFVKLISIIFLFLGILVLFWTRSKGGLVALTASLSVILYSLVILKNKVYRKFWYVLPSFVAIILLIFVSIFYNTQNLIPFYHDLPNKEEDTLQIRYFIWAGTINLLKDHLLLGAGLNGFKTVYSEHYVLKQYTEAFQYPHNIFLTFWAETGILGLFSFLSIFISLIGMILRRLKSSEDQILGVCMLGILSYWFVHGLVDVPYFKNDLSMEFWIVAAVINIWASKKHYS